jgi:hypothetical protein
MQKTWLTLVGGLLLATVVVVIAVGCGDDKSSTPAPTPPDLPPQSSFIMTFDDFASNGSANAAAMDRSTALSSINWGQSALRVGFWNLAIAAGMVVPTAAFIGAFLHDPVQQGDGSWAWTYTVTVDVDYTCKLVGRTTKTEVQWKMYISKAGEYSDYLWYSGSHNLPATEGSWTVNRDPNQSNSFLKIEWNRYPSTSTGDLKYTNIIPENSDSGGYIFYGTTTAANYDRFYHIYNKSQDNLCEIEWNHLTANGRVKDEFFYHDTDWHCWDGNLEDVECGIPVD